MTTPTKEEEEEERKKKEVLAERKRKRLEAWRKRQQHQQEQEQQQQQHQQQQQQQEQQQQGVSSTSSSSLTNTNVESVSNNNNNYGGLLSSDNIGITQTNSNTKNTIKKAKVSISLLKNKKKKRKKNVNVATGSGSTSTSTSSLGIAGRNDDDDDDDNLGGSKQRRRMLLPLDEIQNGEEERNNQNATTGETATAAATNAQRRKRKWDLEDPNSNENEDDLDAFMNQLQAGVMGTVAKQQNTITAADTDTATTANWNINGKTANNLINANTSINSGNSMIPTLSGGIMTPEALALLNNNHTTSINNEENQSKQGHSESKNNNEGDNDDDDDEEEEKARRSFLAALRKSTIPSSSSEQQLLPPSQPVVAQLASEVQSEKQRREARMQSLKKEAVEAQRAMAKSAQPDIGRIFYSDVESGVMEEAERTLDVMNNASVDALEVLADLNKKKELKAVDHSQIEYLPIKKNLYIVPRKLANLTEDEMIERRVEHKIRVRGRGAPAPVETFEECGISERIVSILRRMKIFRPFAVQSQCLPCIMAGRDVIGIAKTGSGKTLAYLLPMLRHIADQPDLAPHESGPIGLVLAPARELAVQIYHVCKSFAKQLGIKSTVVYGGAGVAEQIADLKRGTHIAVGTPGRIIDILTMQAGKILSLQRVSYVVLDEADRMFDMGFESQISAILSAVRPDRQTVLFSATFPQKIENLAKKTLKYPIEVLVGGRSVASDSVKQHGEVVEEEDKFVRLLQLLGEYAGEEKKVIVFVDTQVRADSVFQQLIQTGWASLSLHGGKEQEDRDSTISDFKRANGPFVLVATSVAGRGLDVTTCIGVINYSAPNHLEDYVHRIGRTGRAGNSGVAYTFVNSGDEAKYAPIVVRAMIEAGQSTNISPELRSLSDSFKEKVERGEARYAGSGYKGKGYSYDSSELNDAQKLARLEKRQALIEAGMIDPEEEDTALGLDEDDEKDVKSEAPGDSSTTTTSNKSTAVNLSAGLLALPGMKEAMMRKAGIGLSSSGTASGNHFVEEVEINDYPREARWKVTQKETTSRLQDEFQAAVTLKGKYIAPNTEPEEGERRLYLHVEATTDRILQTCIHEIKRLLNEETLRVGTKGLGGSHKYNVL